VDKKVVPCEFILNDQRCRAVTKNEEAKEVRNASCNNEVKYLCCYLCFNREKCDISCVYLDKPEDVRRKELGLKIEKVESKLMRLATLYADGKIGEQTYLTTAKTLEKRLMKLKKIRNKSEAQILTEEDYLGQMEETPYNEFYEKPTALWYLVPFFFGIIGGLIGYIAVKEEDKEMADSLLIFGVVWTILLAIAYWLFMVYLTSLLWRL